MSLIAWWPLSDGSLKNLVDDSNPLVANGNITNSTIGKIGANSYSNSSLANGLGLGSTKSMTLQNTQSMFCWIYVKSHEWLSGICNHHYYTNPSGMGLNMNASGQIAVSTASTKTCTGADSVNGKYRTYFRYCSEGTVPINTWCHVGYVFDNGKLSLYINGARQKIVYAGTNTGVYEYSNDHLQSMIFADTKVRIFNWSGAHDGYGMLGNICDVRIYNHALSVKEVKELAKGLVLHYTFDNSSIESTTNLLPLGQQTQSNTAATIEVTSGLVNGATYTLSTYVTRDPACTSTNPRLTLRFFYSDGTNTAVSKYNDGGASYPKDGVERYYYITATADPGKTLTKVGGWLLDHSSGSGKKMTATRSQLEIKDHPTLYTPDTRSAILSNNAGTNIGNNIGSANTIY